MELTISPSTTALALAGVALLAISSYYFVTRCGKRRRYPPVVGTMFHQLYHVRRLHDYHTDLFRQHQTFQLLALAGPRQIYTCDPSVVEHILKTNFANYGKGPSNYEKLSDLFGDGIFAVDGDKWRQQRKIASYDFSTRALRDFSGAVFKRIAVKLAGIVSSNAASKKSMDFQRLALKATMDSIFTISFGLDLDTLGGMGDGNQFAEAFDDASELTLLRFVNAFWKVMRFFNIGSEALLQERMKVVDEFVYKHIRARVQELSLVKAESSDSRQDILSRFIEASTKHTGTVDIKYLRDTAMNIVIAGRDTTAVALAWFLYMACKHPEIQDRIFQEVRDASNTDETVSADEFSQRLRDDALNKMHYLHAALTETLRLYPSLPLDVKECFSDDVLPNGFSVSKGDNVFYIPYSMGRMEYLWGNDAQAFRPERWLDENGTFQQESPFKFTAFQAGPRICLGKDFAYRQMKIFTAVLLRFFVFRLRDERASVNYRTMINLHVEHGLHIIATER